MATIGFVRDDFEVFGIPTFAERMLAIKERVRPHLIDLGEQLQAGLNRLAQGEVFPHVAKHARRTVNPPPETWVAFGPSPRGYKKFGYFGLAISQGGLHTRIVVKDEAENRARMSKLLKERATILTKVLGTQKLARYDRWDYAGIPAMVKPSVDFWESVAESLARKTGVFDVGFGWPVNRAVKMTEKHLLEAFDALVPLYEITRL